MAHSLSAKKRHRQSLRRQERNKARTTAARGAVRRARELIAAGAQEEAQAAVRAAASILDRAGRKRVVHPNNAARRKSRLMRQLSRLGQAPVGGAETAKRGARAKAPTKRATRAKKG